MKYRPPFVFTDEEFYSAIEQGKTVKEMAELFGVNRSSIYKRIKRRKTKLQKKPRVFDDTIFDCIDTEEKAYWLGFLYADGCVTNKKKRHCVELSLKASDTEHLYKFNDFLGINRKLNRVKIGNVNCGDVVCKRCRISISSVHLCESLEKLGCVPQKSLILKFPDKSIFKYPELVYDFIRGYVDGDGSIRVTGKLFYTIYLRILGTKEFLDGLLNALCSPKDSYHILHERYKNNTYDLVFKTVESRRICDLIYAQSNISLNRKYEKYKFAVTHSNVNDNNRAKTVKAETC